MRLNRAECNSEWIQSEGVSDKARYIRLRLQLTSVGGTELEGSMGA
jgi:hypothetical protein